MKLTLEPTDKIQTIDGARCRLWTGTTASGIPVHAYIAAVSPQTNDETVATLFKLELNALPEPRISGVTYDLRFFVD